MNKDNLFGNGINFPLYSVISLFELNGKNILSLGCGSAALEEKLEKECGCKVTGLDYDKNAIDSAKKRINSAFSFDLEKNDLNNVLKNNKFDVVILADILEHLRNPEKVLAELEEVLSGDGMIIISIPNIANWSVRLKLLFGKFDYASHGLLDRTHLKFYTLKNAKSLITNNGYIINEIFYSTSLINIIYDKIKRNQKNHDKNQYDPCRFNKLIKFRPIKFSLKYIFKKMAEYSDKIVTNVFPGLFAYQFIIIAKPVTVN